MLCECLFHGNVANYVTASIIVQQAVEADALHTGDKTTRRREWLEAATCTDADHSECAVLVKFLTRLIVDVGQGVEFVDHDVDVVTSDAMRLASDSLALVCTRDGMELAAADLTLNRVEVSGYGIDAGGVANKHHLVGQLLRAKVQVKT